MTRLAWWVWERITGRRYFAAMDPGGPPSTMVVGYIDRKGEIHVEKMWRI